MTNAFERHGLDHLSASSINLFVAQPAMWAMQKLLGHKSRVGAAAHRGTAVEAGVEMGLFDPTLPLEVCQEAALARFNQLAAGNPDAVTDPTFLGQVIDDTTFSYVCALDEGDDPLTDPSCWIKANPLLGITITEQYLSEVVAQAKAIPGQLNGILRLHFCVWTDAETAWMARATLEPLLAEFNPKAGQSVWLGLDLSQNRDLTALAAVQRNGEKDGKPCFDAWVEVWTPGDTLSARVLRDKQPYDLWVADGFLNAPAGENISFRHVAQALAEMASDYRVEAVAYDRYAFRCFEEEVAELGLDLTFVEHPQGGTKRARPVDGSVEGLWMPGSLRHLEELILEGRIRLKRNPVLISAMMSAVTGGSIDGVTLDGGTF